jgi:AcrR family transcriptional regulator
MASVPTRKISASSRSLAPEDRRAQILEAATRAFAEHGFPRTDVQVIADTLGIGKGTIYRYFGTKEELFLAAVDRGMLLLQENIDKSVEGLSDPLAMIEAAVRAYLTFFDQNPEILELLMQERAEFRDRAEPNYFKYKEENLARWHELHNKLIDQGVFRSIPPRDISDFMSDLLYGMVFTNYFSGQRRTLADQVEKIMQIVYWGIREPKS